MRFHVKRRGRNSGKGLGRRKMGNQKTEQGEGPNSHRRRLKKIINGLRALNILLLITAELIIKPPLRFRSGQNLSNWKHGYIISQFFPQIQNLQGLRFFETPKRDPFLAVSPLQIAFLRVQNRKKFRRASRAEFSEFESVVTLFTKNLMNFKRGGGLLWGGGLLLTRL